MKKVNKKERWNFVKDKNVVYSAEGNYPYIGVWKDRRTGNVIAKDVPIGKHLGISTDKYEYYIVS